MPSLRRPCGRQTGKPFNCKGVVLSDARRIRADFSFPTSLAPKPPPTVANLKRKRWKFQRLPCNFQTHPCDPPDLIISVESTSPTKKYKKTLTGKHASGKDSWDLQDQAALNRRAERFKREPQIDRQKWNGNDQSSFHHSSANTHQDAFYSTSSTGNWDEPENDIVTCPKLFRSKSSFGIIDHATQDRRNLSGVIQGLPSAHICGLLLPFFATVHIQLHHRNPTQRKYDHTLCYARQLTN